MFYRLINILKYDLESEDSFLSIDDLTYTKRNCFNYNLITGKYVFKIYKNQPDKNAIL
jgi:hypothetical protein